VESRDRQTGEIQFDFGESENLVSLINRSLESGLFNRLPKLIRDRLSREFLSGGDDIGILASGATTLAGDHVIRLGFSGLLEELASALSALECDLVGRHDG
jgi:hypothetical protein